MALSADRRPARSTHPVFAFLLAAMVPLFLGALLADIAYVRSYQIQWINFAAWLLAGAMVFAGVALVWSLVEWLRVDVRRGRSLLLFLLLLATFALGLIDNFVHARDAYGTMPGGLVLSLIVLALALASTWIGFSALRAGGVR